MKGLDFGGWLVFWSGAVVVMAIAARIVFREQIHEWRTLRLMGQRIAPFFPEFEPLAVQEWVNRAAPHVWRAWRTRELGQLDTFSTPAFVAGETTRFEEEARRGHARDARLGKILKVHTLGLSPIGAGPPPADLELELRVEVRGVDCVRDPGGALVSGQAAEREMQQFWTLRHDGRQWRLHQVRPAVDDRTDLARRPFPPPIAAWRRPESDGSAA